MATGISDTFDEKRQSNNTVIVAVKTVEGQGINMQGHADAILCRLVRSIIFKMTSTVSEVQLFNNWYF